MRPRYDVVITGGGLAGLTLARQLIQEDPGLRILVAEKRVHPAPEAAYKVGESSVEIGAHYFSHVLGLDAHLQRQQLYKLGLRYFFTADDNRRIEDRAEAGPRVFPKVPSFQLDRGRLENYLVDENRAMGIDVVDDCRVREVRLDDGGHTTTLVVAGDRVHEVRSRWVVDGTGRHGLLRRALDLRKTASHGANAVWFRFDSRIKVDDWGTAPAWRAEVPSGERWMSTVHLMGRGYWTWLIPLASGSTSVGIVADGDLHPYASINRFEKAMTWLHRYEPQCAEVLEDLRGGLEDFLGLHHYAHGCTQMYGAERWALIGEAGPFSDPFYSPGSDFIAIGNDLTTELILRDRRGEPIDEHAAYFSRMYLRLFDAFLRLYDGQYPIMGNAQVMTAKVAWDNACYWGISAQLYFQRRYRDLGYMRSLEPLLYRFFLLHARMQRRLREWDAGDESGGYARQYVNFMDIPWLRGLQMSLADTLDESALTARLHENLSALERFAELLLRMAAGETLARDEAGVENVGALQLGSHLYSAGFQRSVPITSTR
jgi:flavin-dependent dehydrogenase